MQKLNWTPPSDWLRIKTIDAHTGGEPLRIILDGLPEIKGTTILEKRRYFRENYDYIRTGLMWEPRGHADQYGAVLTEATESDSDFGTFFLHNEGYSTMCGHAIIALTKVVLDTGIIEKGGANPILKIDTPAGQVTAQATRENGTVIAVSFQNVPSFVYASNQKIQVEGIGGVTYDIAFGGAFYAYCNAEELGLSLAADNYGQLIDWGRRIKHAVMKSQSIVHPFEEDLSFLYGTIFIGKAHDENHHSRNVCIFADGEVDRSPTGTGVSARAALHYAKGELKIGEKINIESILGTLMSVQVIEETTFGKHKAVIPEVGGMAHITGINEFCFDPADGLNKGFIFR